MTNKCSGVVLSLLLSRHDMNHDNWSTVEWSRVMARMARDLDVCSAVTDLCGRPIVDALPRVFTDVDVYGDDEPVTLRMIRVA